MGGASSAGSSGSTAGGAGAGGSAGSDGGVASKQALGELEAWLAVMPRSSRAPLAEQAFATTPLTKDDAESARELLWNDFADDVRETRTAEMGADEDSEKSLTIADYTLRYYQAVRGSKPSGGFSLFISMHGGGATDAATNDGQWENQIALVDGYNPSDAIWVAPRAPTDDWNMWFKDHVDGLFERLVTNFIVFEGVDPNRVYLTGYSAGGDGAYQLGPRMADSWAGVGMSAGHPNDASPVSLRNTPFALHVGANDTAYDRHLKAAEWGEALDALAAGDAGGYPHQWQLHDGKGHWMDLADAVSIPFLQGYARDPIPQKVVWRQASLTKARFYWLATDRESAVNGAQVTASYAGNQVEISEVSDVPSLTVRLSDAMMDLDQPVTVVHEGSELFSGQVARTIDVLYRTLGERGDPALMFSAEITALAN